MPAATVPDRRSSLGAQHPERNTSPRAQASQRRPPSANVRSEGLQHSASTDSSSTEPAKHGQSEAPILFQDYFKSPGPRTYAAQVKLAKNDNHFLVITEGKRDEKTGEVRKTKVLVFSEDFESFFEMIDHVRLFVRANPVPREVAQRQRQFWEKRGASHSPGNVR